MVILVICNVREKNCNWDSEALFLHNYADLCL